MLQRCEKVLSRMIMGEEQISLADAEACVTVLMDHSRNPPVLLAGEKFLMRLRIIDVAVGDAIPASLLARLRIEAFDALEDLVDMRSAEAELR